MNSSFLQKLGFSDKSAKIYLALLQLGPSSVRSLAEYVDLNRGTTYDALKWLQDMGVVSFFNKENKQHFVAEHPEKLKAIITNKHAEIERAGKAVDRALPELVALHHKGGSRPVAQYFSRKDIPKILEDILETCEDLEEPLYRIYSAEGMREYLYEGFPTFSDVRIAKGIAVHVIALGEGGELRGFDKRKWLKRTSNTPTYIILYQGKVASISLDAKGEPIGVVIENDGVYETQKEIFDALWQTL